MKDSVKGIDKNILELLSDGEKITSMKLHEEYEKKFGKLSQTAFRNHIKNLKNRGLIKVESTRTGTRGRKYYISLLKRKIFKS
jgi:predicted ArsR family transcriptional regulator